MGPSTPPANRRRGRDRRRSNHDRRGGAFRGGRRASDLILASALAAGGFAAQARAAEPTRPVSVPPLKVGRRATDLVGVAALPAPAPDQAGVVSLEAMRFGVDMSSVGKATAQGLAVSYGAFWVGAWSQKQRWSDADSRLREAREGNVVPVV